MDFSAMEEDLQRNELEPLLRDGTELTNVAVGSSSIKRGKPLPVGQRTRPRPASFTGTPTPRSQWVENLFFWLVYAALLVSSIAWALSNSFRGSRRHLPAERDLYDRNRRKLLPSKCESCVLGWRDSADTDSWLCSLKLSSRMTLGRDVRESVPVSTLEKVKHLCSTWRSSILYPDVCHGREYASSRCSTFLWISDLHIDLWFDPNVPSNSYGEFKVCRDAALIFNESLQEGLTLGSQMMRGRRSTASAFAYGRAGCDPPFRLLESLTQTMQKVDSEPEFVLITGDIAPHYLPSRSLVLESLSAVAQHLAATICEDRNKREEASRRRPKCVVAIGNVDLFPTLYIPEEPDTLNAMDTNAADDSDAVRFSDVYNIYAKAGLIDSRDDELRRSFIAGGYYRAYDDDELRILVYNSLHYVSNRLFKVDLSAEGTFESQAKKYTVVPCEDWEKVLAKTSDPAGQLAWLDRELAEAERSGRSVFLVSHIGPGSKLGMRSWCERYAKSFANLLRKYNKTISMQFYGDLPREEMRIIDIGGSSDDQTNLVGLPILVNPGLTPRRLPGGSPTFRHGFMLRRTHATSSANVQLQAALQNESVILLDFHAYAFPLQNTAAERLVYGVRAPAPEWRWRYSFREQYCVENMSTSNMNRLVRRIEADPYLMQAYMIRMNDGFETDIDVDRALQVLRFSPEVSSAAGNLN